MAGQDGAASRSSDVPDPRSSEPPIGRLTRAEAEAAARTGRQVSGPLDAASALHLLGHGRLTVIGRLLAASNATFYCLVEGELPDGRQGVASAVYKPIRGERPLYDFPDGTLACREVAAYLLSEASGWELVPPTVLRDGPFGEGMAQLWIEVDESVDVGDLLGSENASLRRMAVLDAVLNNADRKAGHLLPLPDGRIQGCDNGLCFALEPKLRTVLWQWRGQPLSDEEREVLARLRGELVGRLGERLGALIEPDEVRATMGRIDRLLATGRLPRPDRNRPSIPWPPY